MTDLQTPASRIRWLREAKGWSQETLASKVFVSQVAVSHWENGARLPTKQSQVLLAEALGTTRHFLFGELVA